ncbi:MAG: HK97-gp10 family putative phage morphogenesis protein [Gordonia sp. (in: high G+C Gram-positive bacteria)]|uniref:HK97-gp10 family putative phage morphogenesis protein n=1 Tax=Gordonia sp. (in: high G+C Gram-positive bacteria) TaxID=84139 RepID=UPI003C7851C8
MQTLRVDVRGDKRIAASLRRAAVRMDNPRPALAQAAKAVAAKAGELAAKRTGRLSRQNRARVTVRTATVSNRTRYAWYQEEGTRVMRAHPYLRPALTTTPIGEIFQDFANDITNDI